MTAPATSTIARATDTRGERAPEILVIVLQWGRPGETMRCLDALRRSRDVDLAVTVVDNRSAERDAAARVRTAHAWARVIENEGNLGFAGGNNVVLRELLAARAAGAPTRYCMLLNNDVEVAPDTLCEMLAVARGHDAAAVGAINVMPGSEQITSSGGFIVWPDAVYRDAGADACALGADAFEVQTLAGSTLLLDLDALAGVGILDPELFCVFEETDLCLRLRAAGHRLWLATRARVAHAVGASTPRAVHFYFRFRNRFHFARRHGGRGAVRRMLPALARELAWRLPAYAMLGRVRLAWAIVRGVLDGARGVGGPGPFVRYS